MGRSKKSQSDHDSLVRKSAHLLKKQGYKVQADVPGFKQPDIIRGFRPDVIAKKGTQRKIVEIETPDSVNTKRDKGQQKAFRQAADQSKNTTFTRKITE